MSEQTAEVETGEQAARAPITPYYASVVLTTELGVEVTSQSMYSLYRRSAASHATAKQEEAAGKQLFDGNWFHGYLKSRKSGEVAQSGAGSRRSTESLLAEYAEEAEVPADTETEADVESLEAALQASLDAQSGPIEDDAE